MEEAGFMTCTAAGHQGAIETFWLHFSGGVMSSIFMYSQLCLLEDQQSSNCIAVNLIPPVAFTHIIVIYSEHMSLNEWSNLGTINPIVDH